MIPAAVAIPAIASGFQALMGFFGNRSSNKSADRSAQMQAQAARYAADLQARSSTDQLNFLREQERQRQFEWAEAQRRNYEIYQGETAREQQRYDSLQSRLQPYRALGAGSVRQFGRPIPSGGSLGARVGA